MRTRLFLLAGLLLLAILSLLPPHRRALRPLPTLAPAAGKTLGPPPWWDRSANAGALPDFLRLVACRDSWVGGDAYVGRQESGWYRVRPNLTLMVAGYPATAPNSLTLDVRLSDGSVRSFPYSGIDPGERWLAWQPNLPVGSTAVSLRGYDGRTTARAGWLGFTEPFSLSTAQSWDPAAVLRTLGAVALAVLLIFGPGLLWRDRRGGSLLIVLWPGPLLLGLGGCACWALGGVLPVRGVATGWVVGSLAALVILATRARPWERWSAVEARLLALVPLVVLGAAARVAFSGGPQDELYQGMVCRSLETGGHSDSRISYHTVQVVANHLNPKDPQADQFFDPWHFSSRGPLAGLAAVPIVLATGGRPPRSIPDQAWEPFDPAGFAAYRITMMALATLALVAVAGLLQQVAGERAGWLGAALVALAPFTWHEAFFSWPKLAAAAWVLGAFGCLLEGEGLLAGLGLGGAYLLHPLALLSAPFLGLWTVFGRPGRPWAGRGRTGLTFCVGLGLVILAWHLANGFERSSQAGFVTYALGADEVYNVSLRAWLESRWTDALNTLLPGYVFFFHARHPSFNPLGKVSGGWVHFFLQYWTAAPFGAGLLTCVAVLPAFLVGLIRKPRVGWGLFLGPLLFLILYWGVATTGLMREAGHVLFLTGWVFLVWSAGDRVPAWVTGPVFAALRAIEVMGMMFATAFVAGNWGGIWLVNDWLWLAVATGSAGLVGWLTLGAARGLPRAG